MSPESNSRTYKKIDQNEFDLMLDKHQEYLKLERGSPDRLSCSRFDLTNINFGVNSLEHAIFELCNLSNRRISNTSLQECEFKDCDMSNTTFCSDLNLTDTIFKMKTNLTNSVFQDIKLRGTQFVDVQLDNTTFKDCSFLNSTKNDAVLFNNNSCSKIDFSSCILEKIKFHGFTIKNGNFDNIKFYHIEFASQSNILDTSFLSAELLDGFPHGQIFIQHSIVDNCNFTKFDMRNISVHHSSIINSDLSYSRWENAVLENVTIDGSDFTHALGLHGRHEATLKNITGAGKAKYSYKWDILSWAIIRKIGSIPLFGVSYLAIIAICAWASTANWYNTQIQKLKENNQLEIPIESNVEILYRIPWLEHIKELPVSQEMGTLLLMIMILSSGATIYRLFCPDIIQEHTENWWSRTLHYEVMTYRVHSYRRLILRWICGLCYIAGGGYVAWHIAKQIVFALKYFYL